MREAEREAYRLHGRLAVHRRRLAEARALIAASPDHALCVSWGKDSLALLYIAAQLRPDIVVLNARYPHPAERLADMDRVRDLVLARQDMARVRYIEVDCPGEWQMYERAGRAFAEPLTAAERAATTWWRREFVTRMRAAQERMGCRGILLGLRSDESRMRQLNVATHGTSYTKRDGQAVALPLARWTGRDVWAVLVAADLPWLRIYDVAADRERARSGLVFATGAFDAIARHGAVAEWREAYPDALRAWFEHWPELRRAARV